MAELEIVGFESVGKTIEAPQGVDTYVAKKAVNFEQPITTDSTIDGRDVAADGALGDSAIQPGDNNSDLTNDAGYEANVALASQAEAQAGTENTKTMTALRTAQAIAILAADLAAVALSGDSDDLIEGVAQLLLTVAERAQIANIDGWRDLEMSVTSAATGGGTPVQAAFGPTGNIKQTAFGVGDSVYLSAHVPHDIKPGSTMYIHVHWSTDGTSTNTVRWELAAVSAIGHNQGNFGADSITALEEAAQGTAWRHMITEDAVGIPAVEIDSLIMVELKRVTNGGTENTDTVFGLFVDFHYEAQQFATPSRTPDFYTP